MSGHHAVLPPCFSYPAVLGLRLFGAHDWTSTLDRYPVTAPALPTLDRRGALRSQILLLKVPRRQPFPRAASQESTSARTANHRAAALAAVALPGARMVIGSRHRPSPLR